MKGLFLTFLWLIATMGGAAAQNYLIQGQILADNGDSLPHTVITVEGRTIGTVAGADGKYQLQLEKGEYTLVVKYLGYKTEKKKVSLAADLTLNFTLTEETLVTNTVYITNDGRDPAFAIIEKAKEKRDYNKKLIPEYTYKAYTRTKIVMKDRPQKMGGLFDVGPRNDGKKEGPEILYLAENKSEVSVREPNDIKEKVIASRVSGRSKEYSLFGSLFLRFSLYDPFIKIEGLTQRGLVSPLSDNTFFFYNFKLLGETIDNGHKLYKIQVIPKRKADPLYAGTLWIVDTSFAIQAFDLTTTKERGLEYVDWIRVKQTYIPVSDEAWKPFSVRFDFDGSTLGFKYGGYSTTVLSDYGIDPKFTKKTFKNEIMVVADSAAKQDAEYWNAERPIELEPDEIEDFVKKDSIEKLKESPEYLDSLTKKNNKFKASALAGGYSYYNYRTKTSYKTQGLLDFVTFNPMEGWVVKLNGYGQWQTGKNRRLLVSPTLRYGFSNQKFSYKLEAIHNWTQRDRGSFEPTRNFVSLAGGDYVQVFGETDQIQPWLAMSYCLFSEQNFARMYQKKFASVSGGWEILNGLRLSGKASFERRSPLPNRTSYTWINRDNVEYRENTDPPFDFIQHDVVLLEATARVRFGNKYITTPDGKLNLGSKYPLMYFTYRKGVPVGSAPSSDFHFARFLVNDSWGLRLFGTLEATVEAGIFFGVKQIQFADYYHFKGNQTFIRPTQPIRQFSLMDYYTHSTADKFLSAHIEHDFGGFWLNKIPGVRKLKWKEQVGAHFLLTETGKPYLEINAGLANILKIIRVDFHFRIMGQSPQFWGVTVGVENIF